MQKKDELPDCPVEMTLQLVANKWRLLIVRQLLSGTKRFNELRTALGGVSQKVLTQHLRSMEESGLIHREAYAEVPPRVEYSLTEIGQRLVLIIDAMWEWGEEYKAKTQGQR